MIRGALRRYVCGLALRNHVIRLKDGAPTMLNESSNSSMRQLTNRLLGISLCARCGPIPGSRLSDETEAWMGTLFTATAGLETAPLADGAVLYNLKTGKFIMLNGSADRLWSELSKPKTEDELVQGLCQAYPDIATPTARQAVSQALESLQRLDLVLAQPEGSDVDRPAWAKGDTGGGRDQRTDYAPPSVSVLDEEDLLKVFQMTAAEISVAGCWWNACSAGCP
jgi:hypothetical protein